MQIATARALVELDAGREVGAVDAYRFALRRLAPLLATVAIVVRDLGRADHDGLPDPDRDLARRPLVADRTGRRARGTCRVALRCGGAGRSCAGTGSASARSSASSTAISLAAGPLLGAILIFASNSSLALLNLVAGVVYAFALPFVALVTAYVYLDVRARHELAPEPVTRELPAEIAV